MINHDATYRTTDWSVTHPCLTPFVMKKLSDRADPHLTHAFWVVYHFMRILTKIRGIPLSISF